MEHFEYYTEHMPLELFVLLGNFLEEIISPLPSFVVLIPAGAAAEVQGRGVWALVWLAVIAGFGRVLAAMILYNVARKSEEALLKSNRRFFGISHSDVTKLSSRLGRTPRRDWLILFLMNGTPMLPTAPLSLACGFLKIPFKMFVSATFLGSIVNGFIYMLLGYAGFKGTEQLERLEAAGYIATALLVLVITILIFRWQRKRRASKAAKQEASKKHQP